jgi:hypothetical protein
MTEKQPEKLPVNLLYLYFPAVFPWDPWPILKVILPETKND